ncbi:3',5'-cyclic adenosine monophosphate phosphodiesterase CpdA [Paenibacillus solanacearum]|uniref:3',5'-cyclic adenosine monophosphate phosphodiesterase CpdA n=1 Tax=Paenibacillus solanacearum TaxID=2048548 RepID=A0A916JXZ3_9BACL|nr:metallophosphoesterase [Paenibacillus solanacearum]CAG7609500.1 3',5'-cyclic adenosine monophosphate phosphodiesterase CpdA [Paenibacillus solanacearum]
MNLPELLSMAPTVFAVGDEYQIMVPVSAECLMWVEIKEERYYDDSNGILRSHTTLHRISVPCEALNDAREYTVCYRKMIERKPYHPITEEVVRHRFSFRPVEGDRIRIFHIADAHNRVESPILAAQTKEGEIDLLVLNGDIPDHSGKLENFDAIYLICAEITQGRIPCVFSRGNHDTRGIYAEHIAEYTPTQHGNSYFTFHVGKLWGLVLDCGEDKDDSHAEYGNTICCHAFRKRQTQFLKKVAQAQEYNQYLYKIVVVHKPFTYVQKPPFDIEQDIYKEWCDILKSEIKPDLMMSGHLHRTAVWMPGCPEDHLGQPCPVVVGAKPLPKGEDGKAGFIGAAITLDESQISVQFVDDKKNILEEIQFEH